MSQNKKIVLWIVVPLLVSCVCLCIAAVILIPKAISNGIATNPADARRIGAEIADYTLPSGYTEQMGMDMFMVQEVTLKPSDNTGPMIMLMQYNTTNLNRQQMEQQMQQTYRNQYQGSSVGMHYVGDRTVTIKGQSTVLTISESTSTSSGGSRSSIDLRQAVGVFQGKGGMTMVMVTGSTKTWDWDMLDQFFQSIK